MKTAHIIYSLSDEDVERAIKYAKDKDSFIERLIVEAVKGYLDSVNLAYLRHSPVEVKGTEAIIDFSVYKPLTGEIKELIARGQVKNIEEVEVSIIELE